MSGNGFCLDGVGSGPIGRRFRRSLLVLLAGAATSSVLASAKGALAIVIRSIGTDYHRNPHTLRLRGAYRVKAATSSIWVDQRN